MSFYMVSGKQVASSAISVAVLTAASAFFVISLINYFDLPEVLVDKEGNCVKVINYKNGDAYSCQDKDIVLRKYHIIYV